MPQDNEDTDMDTLNLLDSDRLHDVRSLRNALGRFATGVTVVTTRTPEGKLEGLTANSFTAVSLDPPLVLWSLRKAAPSLQSFLDAKCFAVNVLANSQSHLSKHFSTPVASKFEQQEYEEGLDGCPLLRRDTLAIFECRTHQIVEAGDHTVFIGKVVLAHYRDGEPLVFAAGQYGTHSRLQ